MKTSDSAFTYRPSAIRDQFYQTLQIDYAKRYDTYDLLSMQIMYNLSQTYARAEAWLSGRLLDHGMTFPGMNVLIILRSFGDKGCPLNMLSELLWVSRANITGVVDHVERKKYVVRHAHATDRRVILAKITTQGKQWLDNYLPGHYTAIKEMLSGLNSKKKSELIELLRTLRQGACTTARSAKREGPVS